MKASGDLDYAIFATGMHMLSRYGSTVNEIYKAGFDKVFTYINQDGSSTRGWIMVLANTIQGLGHYVREHQPDLIVVHGDRVEALAGADRRRAQQRARRAHRGGRASRGRSTS